LPLRQGRVGRMRQIEQRIIRDFPIS
jgi:hypothetical protein